MTFHEASELMLLEAESRRLSPKTIRFYRQRLAEAERQIGNKPIKAITHHDVRLALSKTSARFGSSSVRVAEASLQFSDR